MPRTLPRRIAQVVRRRLAQYPAVALVGPRQSGKTTLARQIGGEYFDLEQEPQRLRLDLEWPGLAAGRRLVILDEAQTWPELFARLRGEIDRDRRRNGRFLLLGSVSPALAAQVAESLAGRLSVVELTPLTWNELPTAASQKRLWWCGGYPDGGVLVPRRFPRWQLDYLTLIAQRDLPAWGMPAKPQVTDRFFRMLAANHGQAWNASQLGQSLGLSYHTVNTYLDFCAGAFLLRRLAPYHTNLPKRVVKSPKVYWRDSGLLHALLNVPDRKQLLAQPWVGMSWEGFVIEQILAALAQADCVFQPYFLRTSDSCELDLLLDFGAARWAVEIKLTASPTTQDVKQLNRAADLVNAQRRFLISQTRESAVAANLVSWDLARMLEHIEEQFR
ncbi:MAG TPA: ATP-binding protein [Pirellulales bacterium]|nr:ATP-binding protein [Pirellulales bacterium]